MRIPRQRRQAADCDRRPSGGPAYASHRRPMNPPRRRSGSERPLVELPHDHSCASWTPSSRSPVAAACHAFGPVRLASRCRNAGTRSGERRVKTGGEHRHGSAQQSRGGAPYPVRTIDRCERIAPTGESHRAFRQLTAMSAGDTVNAEIVRDQSDGLVSGGRTPPHSKEHAAAAPLNAVPHVYRHTWSGRKGAVVQVCVFQNGRSEHRRHSCHSDVPFRGDKPGDLSDSPYFANALLGSLERAILDSLVLPARASTR